MLYCSCTNLVFVTILLGFHGFSSLSGNKDMKHMTWSSITIRFISIPYWIFISVDNVTSIFWLFFPMFLVSSSGLNSSVGCNSWKPITSFSYKLLKFSSSILWFFFASLNSVIEGLGSSGGIELSCFSHVSCVIIFSFLFCKFRCLLHLIWGFTY